MPRKKTSLTHEANQGIREAIRIAGSQSELAKMLEVTQPAIVHWLYKNCPPNQAVRIEKLTGIRRELTCPQFFT